MKNKRNIRQVRQTISPGCGQSALHNRVSISNIGKAGKQESRKAERKENRTEGKQESRKAGKQESRKAGKQESRKAVKQESRKRRKHTKLEPITVERLKRNNRSRGPEKSIREQCVFLCEQNHAQQDNLPDRSLHSFGCDCCTKEELFGYNISSKPFHSQFILVCNSVSSMPCISLCRVFSESIKYQLPFNSDYQLLTQYVLSEDENEFIINFRHHDYSHRMHSNFTFL